MRFWLACVCCVVVGIILSGCDGSPYYTSDPIEAWVVDAETGEPIEGAIVTANWQLVALSLDSARKLRQLEVKETTTDKHGRFHFSGFTKLNLSFDELREEDPQILIFKPGYRHTRISNNYPPGKGSPGARRTSPVAGQTVRLERAETDVRRRAFQLGFLTSSLMNITESGNSNRIASMLRALACEQVRLKKVDQEAVLSVPRGPALGGECDPK